MALTPPNGLDRDEISTPVVSDPKDGEFESISTTPPPSGLNPKLLDMERRILELDKAAGLYNPELVVCDEKNKEVVRAITTLEVKIPAELVMIKQGIVLCPFPSWAADSEGQELQMRVFILDINDELNPYDQIRNGLLGLAHWPNICRRSRNDQDIDNNETFYSEMVNLSKAMSSYYFDLLVGTEKERLTATINFEKAAETIDKATFIPGPLPKKPEQISLGRKIIVVDMFRMPQIKAAIQKYFLSRDEELKKRATRKNSLAALRIYPDLSPANSVEAITSDVRNILLDGDPTGRPPILGRFKK